MDLSILPFEPVHERALLTLWRAYQEFYRVTEIDEANNRAHVTMIRENPSLGRIHLAWSEGIPLGFSTVYFTFASTRVCRVAVLNDLFVVPGQRGRGVGSALIDHMLDLARREGVRHVRWSTEASNTAAQRLYRRYAEPTSWQMYSVDVSRREHGPV